MIRFEHLFCDYLVTYGEQGTYCRRTMHNRKWFTFIDFMGVPRFASNGDNVSQEIAASSFHVLWGSLAFIKPTSAVWWVLVLDTTYCAKGWEKRSKPVADLYFAGIQSSAQSLVNLTPRSTTKRSEMWLVEAKAMWGHHSAVTTSPTLADIVSQ